MPDLPPKHRLPWANAVTAEDRERARKAAVDEKRKGDELRKLYYKTPWREGSKAFLAMPGNEFCFCGCGRKANMVHHRKPPRSGRDWNEQQRLFWDRTNWLPAHRDCNSRIAARSEGGFGNPVSQPGAGPGGPVRQPGARTRPKTDSRTC